MPILHVNMMAQLRFAKLDVKFWTNIFWSEETKVQICTGLVFMHSAMRGKNTEYRHIHLMPSVWKSTVVE